MTLRACPGGIIFKSKYLTSSFRGFSIIEKKMDTTVALYLLFRVFLATEVNKHGLTSIKTYRIALKEFIHLPFGLGFSRPFAGLYKRSCINHKQKCLNSKLIYIYESFRLR